MKTIAKAIMFSAVVGLAAPLSHAGLSINDAAAACKTEAQARYAQDGIVARIKFKGIYGGSQARKVRLQVLPAEGKSFLAVCEVNGKSGDIVSLTPQNAPSQALASTTN